jgi:hypothetical protein
VCLTALLGCCGEAGIANDVWRKYGVLLIRWRKISITIQGEVARHMSSTSVCVCVCVCVRVNLCMDTASRWGYGCR